MRKTISVKLNIDDVKLSEETQNKLKKYIEEIKKRKTMLYTKKKLKLIRG